MDEKRAVGGYDTKNIEYASASTVSKEFEHTSNLSGAGGYEANMLLTDTQKNFKKIVELSHYYSDKIGILKSSTKFYATLTLGDIRLEGGLKKNKAFLEEFIKKVKLNKVLRQSIPDLYKAGNFFWYREKKSGSTIWVHQLNPVDVEVLGHRMDRPIANFYSKNDPRTLPQDFKEGKFGKFDLPEDKTYHCALDREGYLRYGKPITISSFEPIQHIQELMDMEKQSIDSVIENLIIITLGDEKRMATREQVEDLKTKVEGLKSSSRLVGNHTLKAQVIEKDVAVFNPAKFDVPMRMLLHSIGVPHSLFTGESSYSGSATGLSAVKKTIEANRQEVVDTLEQLFRDVAEEAGMNPDKNPEVSLARLDLTEEKVQHQLMRNLYLDGVISAETYALVHGHDLEIEQDKISKEEKYEIEPRGMSSTISGGDEGRPSEGDGESESVPRPSHDT